MTDTVTRASSNGITHPGVDPATARLLRGLGWASFGFAVPQLVRPEGVTRAVGVGDGPTQRAVVKAVGARELVHAAGLLTPRLRPRWVWTRVAGDAIDLAALGVALQRQDGRGRRRRVVATAAIVTISAIDVYAAIRSSRHGRGRQVELTATTTVRKRPEEVYAFWRRLENLPSFMAHVDDVRTAGSTRSHWTVTAPFGRTVEWDADIVEEVPGQRLSWRSVEGADIQNEGSVRFVHAPGDRGTEVRVAISYKVPGGRLGEALARFAGEEPHQQLDDDLRRFKQVMETGEVVRSDGAPGGKRARHEFPQHPARPLDDGELAELTREKKGTRA